LGKEKHISVGRKKKGIIIGASSLSAARNVRKRRALDQKDLVTISSSVPRREKGIRLKGE